MAPGGMANVSPCQWKTVSSSGNSANRGNCLASGVRRIGCEPISGYEFLVTLPPRTSAINWPPRQTLRTCLPDSIAWLITDKGYDSDPLRERLAKGIELICPYRSNNKKQKYHDGRKMRRYQRRYKVERTFSWLGNFRRLVVRWDHDFTVYNAFFHIACLIITLRWL